LSAVTPADMEVADMAAVAEATVVEDMVVEEEDMAVVVDMEPSKLQFIPKEE